MDAMWKWKPVQDLLHIVQDMVSLGKATDEKWSRPVNPLFPVNPDSWKTRINGGK